MEFEPLLAIDPIAKSVLDGDALGVVGWLEKGVKVRLLRHGHCYCREFAEDELGSYTHRDQTGCILFELVT